MRTPSLMGRLFVVPAVLVALFICLSVVVLLFGGLSVGQRPTIAELLQTIERGSGRHTAGVMLMPRDREVWQAAQELASRLLRKEQELTPIEIDEAVTRIERILREMPTTSADEDDARQPKRLFLTLALARLGTDEAIRVVGEFLNSDDAMVRQFALRGLVELRDRPPVQSYVPRMLELLNDPSHEVQMIACLAVGSIAAPKDLSAIRALREKLAADREVQWNAALALARLASAAGKPVLLNMLSRPYWEKTRVEYVDGSRPVDRSLTEAEVSGYLRASVEAAGGLADADVRSAIRALGNDRSADVRAAVRTALSGPPDAPASAS